MNCQRNLFYLTKNGSNLYPLFQRARNVPREYRLWKEGYKLSTFNAPVSFSQNKLVCKCQHLSAYRLYSQAPEAASTLKDGPHSPISPPEVKFGELTFDSPVSHERLMTTLQSCKSIDDQMEMLASTLSLTDEDIQSRKEFCKTLETLFQPFFGDVKIQIFGSTVNCCGFKGCDIDMTFTSSKTKFLQSEDSYIEKPDVPLLFEVLSGKVSPQEISELPYKDQLLFIHSVLLEYYKESEEPTIFINAHVPLVRFYHDKFNLKCDLTFKNKVAYANTKMLYLFARLDKRVIPLMMTLRYWAKHLELVGKGLLFNSYTISLLLIHFLQIRNPPVLPSAQHILSLTDGFAVEDMDDKSFLDIIEKIPPSKNNETLGELLKEFFFYYLFFDFTRVVCPLIANSVPREEFFANRVSRKFRMNTICVQDPLDLEHNVAELVDFRHCKLLVTHLMLTCKMFQNLDILNPSTEPWGLMLMFDKPSDYSFKSAPLQKSSSFYIPITSKSDPDNIAKNQQASEIAEHQQASEIAEHQQASEIAEHQQASEIAEHQQASEIAEHQQASEIAEHQQASVTAENILNLLNKALLIQCKRISKEKTLELLNKQDEMIARHIQEMESAAIAKEELKQFRKRPNRKVVEDATFNNKDEKSIVEEFQILNRDNELIMCAECTTVNNTWLGRDFVPSDVLSRARDLMERERLISTYVAEQNKRNESDKKTQPFRFLLECYISRTVAEPSILVNCRPLQRMSFNPVLAIFLTQYVPKLMKKIGGV